MRKIAAATLALVLSFPVGAGGLRAENWPGWRGPRGDGTSLEKGVPVRWSSTENIAWRTAVPYLGHASPIVWNDRMFGNGDHDGDAYIVALDKSTGETLWKTPRENRTRSYCTPLIRDIGGRTRMVLSGNKCVASYDPHDGSRHWIIDGPTEQFVASIVDSHELLFVTGGFPDLHVLAINPEGKGNITDSNIVWRHRGQLASYVPSPIALGDYFLVASDGGLATCLDVRSGKVQWSKKLSRHYSASLVASGGLAYFLDDFGVMQVVRPGPEFEAVAVNSLFEP